MVFFSVKSGPDMCETGQNYKLRHAAAINTPVTTWIIGGQLSDADFSPFVFEFRRKNCLPFDPCCKDGFCIKIFLVYFDLI